MTTPRPTSSRHEAPEVGSMVGRMLNALVRRAAEGDTEALEQLQAIEQLAASAMTAGVALAHEQAGYSWGELSRVTGTSRQNLSQRAGRAVASAACGHLGCTGRRRCLEA